MNLYRYSFLYTFLFSLFSLIILIINENGLIDNIVIGVFTGSLVSASIFLVNFIHERQKLLNESYEYFDKLYHIITLSAGYMETTNNFFYEEESITSHSYYIFFLDTQRETLNRVHDTISFFEKENNVYIDQYSPLVSFIKNKKLIYSINDLSCLSNCLHQIRALSIDSQRIILNAIKIDNNKEKINHQKKDYIINHIKTSQVTLDSNFSEITRKLGCIKKKINTSIKELIEEKHKNYDVYLSDRPERIDRKHWHKWERRKIELKTIRARTLNDFKKKLTFKYNTSETRT